MTMYVRTLVPITLTISSQTDEDDVLLDANNPVAVLPLWAAQRPEFQALWADNKVQVATDSEFDDVITEIPASETGAVDTTNLAVLDEGGRIPAGLIPNMIYLEEIHDVDGHTVLQLLDGTLPQGPSTNHIAISNATANHTPYIGVVSESDANVDLQLNAWGGGHVVLNDNSRVLSTTQPVNSRTGDYTLTAADAGALVTVDSSSAQTLTVPNNDTVYLPVGTFVDLARLGTGTVTIQGAVNVTIFGAGNKIDPRFAAARLTKLAPDSWLLTGSLTV